jgi:hypothetical protein
METKQETQMTEWFKIDADKPMPPRTEVLLIAKYPNSNIWSDPVYGWRENTSFIEYARWHHQFPPTHFAFVTMPKDEV